MHSPLLPLAVTALALAAAGTQPASASPGHDSPKASIHHFRSKRMFDIRADDGVVNIECVSPPLPEDTMGELPPVLAQASHAASRCLPGHAKLTRNDPLTSFLSNDFARVTRKFNKSALNFKANHAALPHHSGSSSNATAERLAKRREDVFAKARAMELRYSEQQRREKKKRDASVLERRTKASLDKRAPSGSVPLTDYCACTVVSCCGGSTVH